MINTIKRTTSILIVGTLFLITANNPLVSAQDNSASSQNTTYNYTARSGDSLALMARHSIQLYEVEKKLTLEPSMALYCEATITEELGNIRLNIDQQVAIPRTSVENCVGLAMTLPASQLAEWSDYAQGLSFDTSDLQANIKPSSAPADSQAQNNTSTPEAMNPAEPALPEEPAEPVAPADNTQTAPEAPTPSADSKTKSKVNNYRWLLIPAGLLIILFFLFGDKIGPRRNSL